MSCNKSLLQYANGTDDTKGLEVDCKAILDKIKQIKKTEKIAYSNLYGIRYLLYKFFKSNVVKDGIFKQLIYVNGNQLQLLDNNINVKEYIGNAKFKQNDFLVFECNYNNIKTLLIIYKKEDTRRSEQIFIKEQTDETYNFFYHNYLILYEKTLEQKNNETLTAYIKKLSQIGDKDKKINLKIPEPTSQLQQQSQTDDRISQEVLDKIAEYKDKIMIKKIIDNYDEYNVDKKNIDLDQLNIVITEYYDGNYYDYLNKEKDDEKIYISLLQIFISLIDFYKNDDNNTYKISPENFFYKNTANSISEKYLLYDINNKKYILRTNIQKNLFVLFDKKLTICASGEETYNAVLSLLNILQCGFYSKYLYYGYNSFIVQLVQEIMNQKHTGSFNSIKILKIFTDNIASFSNIKEVE